MEARVHEMVATSILKINFPSLLDITFEPSPLSPCGRLNPMAWDQAALAEAVVAHMAEGERFRIAMLDHERSQKKAAERENADRHASLYRTRQEELSRKMHELEAVEVAIAEAFAR